MSVAGVLNGKVPLRLRIVQSIFRDLQGLTVTWTPTYLGTKIPFASHGIFRAFLEKSTKEGLSTTSPNFMLRVDVRRDSDDAQPRKKGPQGHRKPKDSLYTDMESIMALPQKRRLSRGFRLLAGRICSAPHLTAVRSAGARRLAARFRTLGYSPGKPRRDHTFLPSFIQNLSENEIF